MGAARLRPYIPRHQQRIAAHKRCVARAALFLRTDAMSSQLWSAIAVSQVALVVGGLMLLWRFGLSARARRTPAALAPWEISVTDFFMMIWCVIAGGFIAPFAAGLWLKGHPVAADTSIIMMTALFHLGMLAGVIVFKATTGRRSATLPIISGAPSLNPVLAGLTAYLVTLPIVLGISLVWQVLLKACDVPAPAQDAIDILRHAHPLPRALLLVSAIVLAPFTEELIFRAGIFRYTRTRLPRWAALLLPSMLFGAMHMNLASFAPLVALGIVFSLAYERTGRISTTIIAHGLFNLTTTLLILAGIDV